MSAEKEKLNSAIKQFIDKGSPDAGLAQNLNAQILKLDYTHKEMSQKINAINNKVNKKSYQLSQTDIRRYLRSQRVKSSKAGFWDKLFNGLNELFGRNTKSIDKLSNILPKENEQVSYISPKNSLQNNKTLLQRQALASDIKATPKANELTVTKDIKKDPKGILNDQVRIAQTLLRKVLAESILEQESKQNSVNIWSQSPNLSDELEFNKIATRYGVNPEKDMDQSAIKMLNASFKKLTDDKEIMIPAVRDKVCAEFISKVIVSTNINDDTKIGFLDSAIKGYKSNNYSFAVYLDSAIPKIIKGSKQRLDQALAGRIRSTLSQFKSEKQKIKTYEQYDKLFNTQASAKR